MTPDKYTTETITDITHLDAEAVLVPDDPLSRLSVHPGPVRAARHPQATPEGEKIVWRAYSIVSADYDEFLEFYSIVVPEANSPATSPICT